MNRLFALITILEPGDDTCGPILLASLIVSLRVLHPMVRIQAPMLYRYRCSIQKEQLLSLPLLRFGSPSYCSRPSSFYIQSASDSVPRLAFPPVLLGGLSRVRSRHRSRHNVHEEEHDSKETHSYARFQSMLDQNSWVGIVSTVKQQIHKIKEKYFIPHGYELVIPWSFDRMHYPPRGFCSFSLHHFDTGLRLPLAPPVAHILTRLNLCPMQLSPNSIRHIILFIIIMKVHRLEPSIDNFWSLCSFTTSTRSADRGFFYLSARKECRFLEPLTSNVGPWKKKFVFIRPPSGREWPFRLDWVLEKPNPITEGGRLEGDQINSLTFYRYDPKKILVEEILWLACLTPAPVQITWLIKLALLQCIRAVQARAAAGQVAPVAPPTVAPSAASTQPELEHSTANVPNERAPIEVVSGDTQSGGLRGDPRSNHQSESARAEEARNMELFNDVSKCWKKAREELRSPPIIYLHRLQLVTSWFQIGKFPQIAQFLARLSGHDSWELYEAICPPRRPGGPTSSILHSS
ncbi:UNVERIFIED_CONTAM: hypothetical protein Sindi_0918100 [Sesamum indicum]